MRLGVLCRCPAVSVSVPALVLSSQAAMLAFAAWLAAFVPPAGPATRGSAELSFTSQPYRAAGTLSRRQPLLMRVSGNDDDDTKLTTRKGEAAWWSLGGRIKTRKKALLFFVPATFLFLVPQALLVIVYVGGQVDYAGADSYQRTLDLLP